MPILPPYDKECVAAMESAKAEAAFLMILNGDRGTSFAANGPMNALRGLPEALRAAADDVAQQIAGA